MQAGHVLQHERAGFLLPLRIGSLLALRFVVVVLGLPTWSAIPCVHVASHSRKCSGQFNPEPGQSTCLRCLAGTAGSATGASSCPTVRVFTCSAWFLAVGARSAVAAASNRRRARRRAIRARSASRPRRRAHPRVSPARQAPSPTSQAAPPVSLARLAISGSLLTRALD